MAFAKRHCVGVVAPLLSYIFIVSVLLVQNVEGKRCSQIDVRNTATELMQLENCTIIAGSVTIVLIEFDNSSTFEQYSFPQLKEITGYLAFYRVLGITSLAKLFPNLTVIRGHKLIAHYALMIFEMPDLQQIGFQSLIQIQHGFVVVHRCPLLCYTHAIDWEAMTFENESTAVDLRKTNLLQQDEYNGCPTINSCRGCEPKYCWNSMHCQKYHSDYTPNGKIRCHHLCLGGCINETAAGCNLCVGPSLDGICVEKCPNHKFLSQDTNACVDAIFCHLNGFIPVLGECRTNCPRGFSSQNPSNEVFEQKKCYKCRDKCPTVCRGSEIVFLSDMENLHGCTIINGSLHIRLDVKLFNTHNQLERNLGDIEEIWGLLLIQRSPAISSLSFLKNLKVIHDLQVVNNGNLHTLWDWSTKGPIVIVGGSIAFHYNPKLCIDVIHKLQKNLVYNNSRDFISYDSNGDEESCQFSEIKTTAVVNSYHSVTVVWKQFDLEPDRKLMGYFVNLIESPFQNMTYSRRECSAHSWKSIFLPIFKANTILGSDNRYRFNLEDLKGNTQYAFYVTTQVSLKNEDKIVNITQGQSDIKYFHTQSHPPLQPFVKTLTKSNDSITLTWYLSSRDDRPKIDYYIINVYVLPDTAEQLDRRNYCSEPKQPEILPIEQYHNEVPECCPKKVDNEQSLEAFIGLDDELETCGEDDPECTLRYGYNNEIYRRKLGHSWPGLADAPGIRELDYIDFPLPKYIRKGKTEPSTIKPIQSESQKYLFQRNISKMTSHYRIENLKPYILYVVNFFACNSVCSPYFYHTERTVPCVEGDNVELTLIQDAVQYNTIHIKVPKPPMPNGLTLSYEIERLLPNGERIVDCITRKRHEMKSNGFTIYRLQDGRHSIRARSISLGADGKWSNYSHIDIKQKVFLNSGEVILILVLGLLGAAVFVVFAYFCVLKSYIARKKSEIHSADQPGFELINFNADPHAQVEPIVFRILEEPDVINEDDANLLDNIVL